MTNLEIPRTHVAPDAPDGPNAAAAPATPVTTTAIEPLAVDAPAAARLLSISIRSLRALVASNEIPFARLGGRVVFPLADLREWLHRRVKANARPNRPPPN